MTTSGTTGQTIVQVAALYEGVVRRCGGNPADIGPESLEILSNNLYFILSNMSNRGVNLWRLYQPLFALYSGQQTYAMNAGDIDITKCMYRTPSRLSPSAVTSSNGGTTSYLSDADIDTVCTQLGAAGNFKFDWGSGTTEQVALVGLLWGSSTTYNLTMSISNDNVTYTPVYTAGSIDVVAGQWSWYAIDPAGVASRYFKIATSTGILSLAEASLSANWEDVEISRINRDIWMTYPNKRSPGPPRQYWFDRQLTPEINLWPVPSNTFNLMAPMVHRHVEDVGVMTNTLDIPQRWYQAIQTLLAAQAFLELPKALVDMTRYPLILNEAKGIALPDAEAEERDDSAVQIIPGIRAYTS